MSHIEKALAAMEVSVQICELGPNQEGLDLSLDAARMILAAIEESPPLHHLKERAQRAVDRLGELRGRGVAIDGDCRPAETIPLLGGTDHA